MLQKTTKFSKEKELLFLEDMIVPYITGFIGL
jgi:hypothetical protein